MEARAQLNKGTPDAGGILDMIKLKDEIGGLHQKIQDEAISPGPTTRPVCFAIGLFNKVESDIHELLLDFYPKELEVEIEGERKGLIELIYENGDSEYFVNQFTLTEPESLDIVKNSNPKSDCIFYLTAAERDRFTVGGGNKVDSLQVIDDSGREYAKSDFLFSFFIIRYHPDSDKYIRYSKLNKFNTPDGKPIKVLTKSDIAESAGDLD